jgi:ankyrin repeat protein
MDSQLEQIFERWHGTADFADTDFSDGKATSADGDNAFHGVVRWGHLAAAKALTDVGSDVNSAGHLGYTPLHIACMTGNAEMVKLPVRAAQTCSH